MAKVDELELFPDRFATKSGDIRCVKALLDAGANVSALYWNKCTALHEAVARGNKDITRLLLSKNADPFARDVDGFTPAFVACLHGQAGCLELLISAVKDACCLVNERAIDGRTCVYAAVDAGSDTCLQLILQCGADVNACTKTNIHPISAAAKNHDIRCAKLLLPLIDHNAVLYSSEDPVFSAVEGHQLDMLSLLLEAGLPHDRLTDYFRDVAVPIYGYLRPLLTKIAATPLACAVAKMDLDAVKLLLHYKADTTPTHRGSYSPILLAILKRRKPEILVELLKANPNLNSISFQSICRVPDAALVVIHPLYQGQLAAMLKAGLAPSLPYWCLCKQPKPNPKIGGGNYAYSLLRELSGVLLPDVFAEQLHLILPFSSCGLPNCCQEWSMALGQRKQEFEHWQNQPLSLQHICRVTIRKCFSTGQLASSDQWSDSLPCPPAIKSYLCHNDMLLSQ